MWNGTLPTIDVIIPCYNSEATLEACLKSVYSLDYPNDLLTVIIVDNGSTDNTLNIAVGYNCNITVRPKIRVGAMRNRGSEISNGEIIAFTDSDCIVPANWIKDAINVLKQADVGAVGGGCLVTQHSTWMEKAWVAVQKEQYKNVLNLPASNLIIRRSCFEQVGKFDENLLAGEDDHLSHKLIKSGFKLISIKSCYVVHLGYPTHLFSIMKRQIWHARNSMEIKTGLFDKLFLSTTIFLLCIILIPVSIIYAAHSVVLLAGLASIIVMIVSLASLTKVSKAYYDKSNALNRTIQFIQLLPIYFSFYIGRSIGLLLSFMSNVLPFKTKS